MPLCNLLWRTVYCIVLRVTRMHCRTSCNWCSQYNKWNFCILEIVLSSLFEICFYNNIVQNITHCIQIIFSMRSSTSSILHLRFYPNQLPEFTYFRVCSLNNLNLHQIYLTWISRLLLTKIVGHWWGQEEIHWYYDLGWRYQWGNLLRLQPLKLQDNCCCPGCTRKIYSKLPLPDTSTAWHALEWAQS